MLANPEPTTRVPMKRRRSPDNDDKPRKMYGRPDRLWADREEMRFQEESDGIRKGKKKKKAKKKKKKRKKPSLFGRSRSRSRSKPKARRSVSGTRSPLRPGKGRSEGWEIVSGENKEASLISKLGNLEKNLHMKLMNVGLDEKSSKTNVKKSKIGALPLNRPKVAMIINKKKENKAKRALREEPAVNRRFKMNLLKHSRKPKKLAIAPKIKINAKIQEPKVKEERVKSPEMLPSTMPQKDLPDVRAEKVAVKSEFVNGGVKEEFSIPKSTKTRLISPVPGGKKRKTSHVKGPTIITRAPMKPAQLKQEQTGPIHLQKAHTQHQATSSQRQQSMKMENEGGSRPSYLGEIEQLEIQVEQLKQQYSRTEGFMTDQQFEVLTSRLNELEKKFQQPHPEPVKEKKEAKGEQVRNVQHQPHVQQASPNTPQQQQLNQQRQLNQQQQQEFQHQVNQMNGVQTQKLQQQQTTHQQATQQQTQTQQVQQSQNQQTLNYQQQQQQQIMAQQFQLQALQAQQHAAQMRQAQLLQMQMRQSLTNPFQQQQLMLQHQQRQMQQQYMLQMQQQRALQQQQMQAAMQQNMQVQQMQQMQQLQTPQAQTQQPAMQQSGIPGATPQQQKQLPSSGAENIPTLANLATETEPITKQEPTGGNADEVEELDEPAEKPESMTLAPTTSTPDGISPQHINPSVQTNPISPTPASVSLQTIPKEEPTESLKQPLKPKPRPTIDPRSQPSNPSRTEIRAWITAQEMKSTGGVFKANNSKSGLNSTTAETPLKLDSTKMAQKSETTSPFPGSTASPKSPGALIPQQLTQAQLLQQQVQQAQAVQMQQARLIQMQQMQRRAQFQQLLQAQQLQQMQRAVITGPGLIVPQPMPVIVPQVTPTTLVPVQIAPTVLPRPVVNRQKSFPPANPEPPKVVPVEDDSAELEELKPVEGAAPKESSSNFKVVKKHYISGNDMKLPESTQKFLQQNQVGNQWNVLSSYSNSSYSSRRSSSGSSSSRSRTPERHASVSLSPASKQKRDIHQELLKQRESESDSYQSRRSSRARRKRRRRSRTDSRSRSRSPNDRSSSSSSSASPR